MDVVLAFSYVSYVHCLIAFFFIWFTVFVVCTVIYHFNSNLVASCVLAHRALIHLNFDTYNEVSANGAIYSRGNHCIMVRQGRISQSSLI